MAIRQNKGYFSRSKSRAKVSICGNAKTLHDKSFIAMERRYPILVAFDKMLENLPRQLPAPLPEGFKLQFKVTTSYYQELLQVDNDNLMKPALRSDVMRYKGMPISIDDTISSITLSPLVV